MQLQQQGRTLHPGTVLIMSVPLPLPPRHADLRVASERGFVSGSARHGSERNAFWQSIEYDMIMNVNIMCAPSPTEGKVMLDYS